MAGRTLNISLVATLTPLQKSIEAVGKMMADFASSIEKTDSKLSASIKASVATMNTEMTKVQQSFDNVGKSGERSAKGAGSLRAQIRAATMEAQQAADKFGEFSPEFIAAASKAAKLKDEMGDVAQKIDAMNPDAKFKAFAGVLQGVAGGFMAVEGTMAAFGINSEAAAKTMAKLQGLMAMSQGLNQLGGLKDSMAAMKMQITAMTQGMGGFQKALLATGIGVFVVALGLIAANWDKIKGAVDGVSAEQKKLTELSADHLKKEQDKLAFIESQDNVYKMQGKTERQILGIKIAQTAEVIKAAEIQIQHHKTNLVAQIAASKRNRDILIATIDAIVLPMKMVLNVIDMAGRAIGKNFGLVEKLGAVQKTMAEWIFDPAETEKKGKEEIQAMEKTLAEMKNKESGYKLAIRDLDKKSADDKKKIDDDYWKNLQANFDKNLAYQNRKLKAAYEEEQRIKKDLKDQGFATTFDAKTQKINLIVGELKAPKQLVLPPMKIGSVSLDPKEIQKNISLAQDMNKQIEASMEEMAMTIGEQLGNALSGTFDGGGFLSSILKVVGGFLSSMGKLLIAYAISMDAFKKAFKNPYIAIAAGIALVAIGTAVKNKSEKIPMAKGGIVHGETDVTVGEYPGANSNPEVIAPLSKLKSMLGGDNNRPQQLYSTIYGGQLIMATNKAGGNYRRVNGRVR